VLVVAYLLTMVPPSPTVSEVECSLSDAQLTGLQLYAKAVLGLDEANATCGYNMTLGSIIDGTTTSV
jgi:hypothetical protein